MLFSLCAVSECLVLGASVSSNALGPADREWFILGAAVLLSVSVNACDWQAAWAAKGDEAAAAGEDSSGRDSLTDKAWWCA